VHVAQPFDVVAREFCQLTTQPQQLFVDMSDGERGIMLANIGIYEYQVLPDARRTLALTLLRCTDRIDDSTFATPDFRMNLGQNLGETTFSYSLIPHAGGWQNAYQEAHNFRYPLRAVFCRELEEEALPSFTLASRADDFATQGSFLQLEPSSITISAVKQHEERDTIVVRLFNHTDTPTQARLRLTIPGVTIKAAFLVNLGEVRQEQLTPDAEGWVSFTAVGKGLVTLEFEVGMWSPA